MKYQPNVLFTQGSRTQVQSSTAWRQAVCMSTAGSPCPCLHRHCISWTSDSCYSFLLRRRIHRLTAGYCSFKVFKVAAKAVTIPDRFLKAAQVPHWNRHCWMRNTQICSTIIKLFKSSVPFLLFLQYFFLVHNKMFLNCLQ